MQPRSTCPSDPGLGEGLRQLTAAKLRHGFSAGRGENHLWTSLISVLALTGAQKCWERKAYGAAAGHGMLHSGGKNTKRLLCPTDKGSLVSPAQQTLYCWSILTCSLVFLALKSTSVKWSECISESINLHVHKGCQQSSTSGGTGRKVGAHLWWRHLLSGKRGLRCLQPGRACRETKPPPDLGPCTEPTWAGDSF